MSDGSFNFEPGDLAAKTGRNEIVWWCPGCKCIHFVPTATSNAGGHQWGWNGSLTAPTLSPSVKMTSPRGGISGRSDCCHLFIREGRIEFCGDCTHELSGQTVPMIVPDFLTKT